MSQKCLPFMKYVLAWPTKNTQLEILFEHAEQKSTRSPLPSWPIHPSYKSSGSTSVGWNWNKSTFPTKQQRDYIQYSKYTLYIRCFFGGWLFFGSPHSKGFPTIFPMTWKGCVRLCVYRTRKFLSLRNSPPPVFDVGSSFFLHAVAAPHNRGFRISLAKANIYTVYMVNI